jgi:U-box domain
MSSELFDVTPVSVSWIPLFQGDKPKGTCISPLIQIRRSQWKLLATRRSSGVFSVRLKFVSSGTEALQRYHVDEYGDQVLLQQNNFRSVDTTLRIVSLHEGHEEHVDDENEKETIGGSSSSSSSKPKYSFVISSPNAMRCKVGATVDLLRDGLAEKPPFDCRLKLTVEIYVPPFVPSDSVELDLIVERLDCDDATLDAANAFAQALRALDCIDMDALNNSLRLFASELECECDAIDACSAHVDKQLTDWTALCDRACELRVAELDTDALERMMAELCAVLEWLDDIADPTDMFPVLVVLADEVRERYEALVNATDAALERFEGALAALNRSDAQGAGAALADLGAALSCSQEFPWSALLRGKMPTPNALPTQLGKLLRSKRAERAFRTEQTELNAACTCASAMANAANALMGAAASLRQSASNKHRMALASVRQLAERVILPSLMSMCGVLQRRYRLRRKTLRRLRTFKLIEYDTYVEAGIAKHAGDARTAQLALEADLKRSAAAADKLRATMKRFKISQPQQQSSKDEQVNTNATGKGKSKSKGKNAKCDDDDDGDDEQSDSEPVDVSDDDDDDDDMAKTKLSAIEARMRKKEETLAADAIEFLERTAVERAAVEEAIASYRGLSMSHSNMVRDLKCPLTLDVMEDPVVVSDGHTFEREAIEMWFDRSSKSPMTNQYLDTCNVTPNITLRKVIEQLEKSGKLSAPVDPVELLTGATGISGATIE